MSKKNGISPVSANKFAPFDPLYGPPLESVSYPCAGHTAVKNTDFLVYLRTKNGRTTRFARDSMGWVQMASSGIRRRCTAEQVLNHLLPALVLGEKVIHAKVALKRGRRFNPRLERLRMEP
jgi:hypothetical protein